MCVQPAPAVCVQPAPAVCVPVLIGVVPVLIGVVSVLIGFSPECENRQFWSKDTRMVNE